MSSWVILAIAVIALVGALAGIFWPWLRDILGDKDRGAIVGALLAGSGLMISVWAAQERSSYELRFTAEEERDRRSLEDEKDRKLRLDQELKDRRQHSVTQRIELSRKLTTAIPHIGDSNPLIQAAGIVELLFQIDDWYALTASEMGNEESDTKIEKLKEEGKRRRQEIFNLIYNSRTKFPEVLNARVVGLIERLKDDASIRSLDDLDMSNLQLGRILVFNEEDQFSEYHSANFLGLSLTKDKDIHISGDLSGANFSRSKLFNVSFMNSDISGADFSHTELDKVNFSKAKLGDSMFEKSKVRACNFDKSDLSYVNFTDANLDGESSLEGAIMKNAVLIDTVMNGVKLQLANISHANLSGMQLKKANLCHARLIGVVGSDTLMAEANLSFANLDNANFDHVDLSDSILEGTSLKDSTFRKSKFNRAFLCRADLTGASISEWSYVKDAAFIAVKAIGICFKNSDVHGSNFSFSDLRGSTFNEITITGNVFIKSDLRGADFKAAKIVDAVFDGAYLGNGNFTIVPRGIGQGVMKKYSSWLEAKYSDSTQFSVKDNDPSGVLFNPREEGMIKWSTDEWEEWDGRLGPQILGGQLEILDSIIDFCEDKIILEKVKQKCMTSKKQFEAD